MNDQTIDRLIKLGEERPAIREHIRPVLDHLTQKEGRFWQPKMDLVPHATSAAKEVRRSYKSIQEALARGDANSVRSSIKSLTNSLKDLEGLLSDIGELDMMDVADIFRK